MIYIVGTRLSGGNLNWQLMNWGAYNEEEGVTINFPFYHKVTLREGLKTIKETLIKNEIDWIFEESKRWTINLTKLKLELEENKLENIDFIDGSIGVEPEIEYEQEIKFDEELEIRKDHKTYIRFIATKELIMESKSRKIFLSHKSADKPLVRSFASTLQILGFETWLDEHNLVAGAELERGLLQGFKDSCAAIFFITPNYVDEKFLAKEVDYAIAEKNERGDTFSIITIIFKEDNEIVNIPPLLKRYVFKEPPSQLHAIQEIIKALPIKGIAPIYK